MVKKKGQIIKFFIVLFIFIFAVSLRLWNLDKMGRTWDEAFYVDQGHRLISAIAKGNFTDSIWYENPDPPVLAKYIYGAADYFNINDVIACKNEFCTYDFTSSRLMSVLFSSLTVLLVILIGWEYVSFFVGVTAGIILTTLPILLGLSQLVTIESILIFFFTASTYSFLHLLKTFSYKNLILCGLLLGLAVGTKYTNILLFPLFVIIYFIYRSSETRYDRKTISNKLLYLIPISALTLFIVWPMSWFHLDDVLRWERTVRFSEVASHPVPEVFFGRFMPVPIIYYFIYFLITTPFLILIFFLIGSKKISDEKKWVPYSIIVWFLVPFAQSFLNMRQHGVRYIIEIYVPLSLIAAIGFNYFLKKFKIQKFKLFFLSFLVFYMLIILKNISPYYLDYFNIVVGGTKSVYQNRTFQLGWWGQGIREAGLYISSNAKKGSKIGLALSPITSMPQLKEFDIKKYDDKGIYDYIIINYYNVLREGFDDSKIKLHYKTVYNVKADGANLVTVYKRK